eukprot:scaffold5203_cov22-Tisochrysis_lutea.AAC.2
MPPCKPSTEGKQVQTHAPQSWQLLMHFDTVVSALPKGSLYAFWLVCTLTTGQTLSLLLIQLTRLGWEMAVLTAASIMARGFSGTLPWTDVCSVNSTCVRVHVDTHTFSSISNQFIDMLHSTVRNMQGEGLKEHTLMRIFPVYVILSTLC